MRLFLGISCVLGVETAVKENGEVLVTFWDVADPKEKFQTVAKSESTVSETMHEYITKRRATNGDYPGRRKPIELVLE